MFNNDIINIFPHMEENPHSLKLLIKKRKEKKQIVYNVIIIIFSRCVCMQLLSENVTSSNGHCKS